MNEIRKLKRGSSTKRGDHLVIHGHNPYHEWEEQQRYCPSPLAPPMSPTSPRTPGDGHKKPVLGKVKSKAKKWMNLLQLKKKHTHDEPMWTPRAGPSSDGNSEDEEHAEYHGAPMYESERAPEVYKEASPRQNSPVPSPTSCKEPPFFKVSSRFESEMKEANEMLRESKQLRVNTGKQKTVTFAPTIESTLENERNGWNSRELYEAATEILANVYTIVYEAALWMASRIQDTMVAYDIDRKHMLEKAISVKRYLMLKLEPGEDDEALSEVITEAVGNLLDTWREPAEWPAKQRAQEILSWFHQQERELREESPPVPLSTHPCAYEDAEEFYSLEN